MLMIQEIASDFISVIYLVLLFTFVFVLFWRQCEECLCWQHSVCMGLLEDSIPEQYICYICRDPPGTDKPPLSAA